MSGNFKSLSDAEYYKMAEELVRGTENLIHHLLVKHTVCMLKVLHQTAVTTRDELSDFRAPDPATDYMR